MKLLDKQGALIDLAKKEIYSLPADLQTQIQQLNPEGFTQIVSLQKQWVHASMNTAYTMLFAYCAIAYLLAWSIMKMLVPREKLVNLNGK